MQIYQLTCPSNIHSFMPAVTVNTYQVPKNSFEGPMLSPVESETNKTLTLHSSSKQKKKWRVMGPRLKV